MHDDRVVFADQFIGLVAKQGLGAAIDEDKTAFVIEGVNDVRRLLNEKTVHLFRLLEMYAQRSVFAFDLAAAQGALYGRNKLIRIATLADEFKCTLAQGKDRGSDCLICTENNDRRIQMILLHPLHDLDPADVRQIEIKHHDIDISFIETRLCFDTGGTFFNATFAPGEQKRVTGA